ncbi:MAG: O-antigen ligase family protein [Gammaproteobacteria bacterium]|nr:O-antigen ligase family protein [Gammaproteobacteria bacterium]
MNRTLLTLLLLFIVLAPLPLGSNREWSWTLCALIAGGLGLAWSLRALFQPATTSTRLPGSLIILWILACGWVLVQISPWVPDTWQHPIWSMSRDVTGNDMPGSISLSRDDSLVALIRLLSYGMVFILSFQLCRSRAYAKAVFTWVSVAGLIYAVFGLVTYWGELETRLWFQEAGAHMSVRGPFVNRNSFATYLGLCLLSALALFYQRQTVQKNPLYQVPAGRQKRIEDFILGAWKPLAMVLLMMSALILTYSRAGFGSFILGALTLALAVHYRRKVTSRRSRWALAAAFAVTITAFFMTSEVLLERMDRLNLDAPGRFHVYSLAGAASDDNPWLGFGYGTFADSFRLYRDDILHAHYDMAHNTWMENIFELGWPAAGALFLSMILAALMCLRGVRTRQRDWIFPATGLAASVLVAIHSFFDFSLQMPAVALTYACLLGAACAQSVSPGRQGQ